MNIIDSFRLDGRLALVTGSSAGIQRRAPFQDFAQADWAELMRTNLDSVFLASDAGRFVNGHILYVDGGVTATL